MAVGCDEDNLRSKRFRPFPHPSAKGLGTLAEESRAQARDKLTPVAP
ncbi:MAG: hypothetical protein HYZ73_09820 [Elusimicrobia bacterium]|nr:hypothetical protein [Elusimicrobiota bacterium]